ncbi:MAG: hypothetical protein KAI07_01390, partial [Deltaproteobacteria bacterium]|nr:hypothetical protein [Deltaproteobacteria bacterium]
PMIITGGLEILSKGSAWINTGTMKVKILPAIYVDNLPKGREGREKLMQMVREQMEEVLNEEGYGSD